MTVYIKQRTNNKQNKMTLINGMDDIMTHIRNQELRINALQKENEQLKEKVASHEEFKKDAEDVCGSYAVTESLMTQIEEGNTEIGHKNTEIKGMEKAMDDIAEEAGVDKDDEWFGHFATTIEKIRADKEKYFELKYSGDDWGYVYGKMCAHTNDGDKDVVLCMASGGSHWENYIMTPTMNYIENISGKHPQRGQILIQSDCCKYLSFQPEEDYDCEGDETICEYHDCVE